MGTLERKDGTEQATYAGHPLYTYSGDHTSEANGLGKRSFGSSWSAVRPSGELLEGG
jgi:predicted lipoprotein with Yx(FWY)xxD motif